MNLTNLGSFYDFMNAALCFSEKTSVCEKVLKVLKDGMARGCKKTGMVLAPPSCGSARRRGVINIGAHLFRASTLNLNPNSSADDRPADDKAIVSEHWW